MEFRIESVKFVPLHPQWERFRQDKNQPIGKDLYRRGLRLQYLARNSIHNRTGKLSASIRVNYNRGLTNPKVVIGSNLDYAYWVHEGTRPHQIRTARNRMMRFTYKGRVVYVTTIDHPGSRPQKYLSKHLPTVVR